MFPKRCKIDLPYLAMFLENWKDSIVSYNDLCVLSNQSYPLKHDANTDRYDHKYKDCKL